MTKTSRIAWPCILVALILPGCGDDDAASDDPTAAVPDESRDQNALVLLDEANKARPKEKIPILRRLVARFPDTPAAPRAYLSLVFYLRDPSVGLDAEALEAAITFADRHPDDPNVNEAFEWLVRDAARPDWKGASKEEVLRAWDAYQQRAWREISAGPADEKASFQVARARLAGHRGDQERARELLLEAAGWDLEDAALEVRILWQLGHLQKEVPELRDEALANFERALARRGEVRVGQDVPLAEAIQQAIDELR